MNRRCHFKNYFEKMCEKKLDFKKKGVMVFLK